MALVAHENARMRRQVRAALQMRNVEAVYARTCRDVQAALESRKPPDIIFAGTSFANGCWRDVVTLARAAKPPVDVVLTIDEVVLSSDPDSDSLRLESMDRDAFDLVVLPYGANIAQVLAHRFAKPRALQPRLWQKATSRFRGASLQAQPLRGGYGPRIWDQARHRDSKSGDSKLTSSALMGGH